MHEEIHRSHIPPKHYYISRRAPVDLPEGFDCLSYGPWNLVVDSDFAVLPVFNRGERVGAVCGTILDPKNGVKDGEVRPDQGASERSLSEAFEGSLSNLLGRYVGVLDADEGLLVYTDPLGSLPAVYDDAREIVAASPMAMPGINHDERFRETLFEEIRTPLVSRGENVWIPGSSTYYEGIERLLPNHRLNLSTWESTRYWPTAEDVKTNPNPSNEIENIIALLQSIFRDIVANYERPKMGLTAGKDSRSLLAAAREEVTNDEITLFTIGDSTRNVDVHIAQQLTEANDITWEPLPIIEATAAEQSHWLDLTGYTVGSAVKETYTTMQRLDADVEIGGIGGEIGRSYLWKDSDESDTEIGPKDVLLRYHKPEHPELITKLEEWFRSVEDFDTYTVLDLAHQEHRLGCWGGPQHLGFRPQVDHIRPFSYRPIIESMHRLHPDVRRSDQLPIRIIEKCWPELNDFPYNSFTDWRGYWSGIENNINAVKTVLSNPDFAVEYVSRKHLR